mmetsp:Transcript_32606/g.97300  ORF Transcript_32606/g.97300 Transcript_32606/m.97300 type:complete len:201 (-) Transcript_32606:981-1583(-)
MSASVMRPNSPSSLTRREISVASISYSPAARSRTSRANTAVLVRSPGMPPPSPPSPPACSSTSPAYGDSSSSPPSPPPPCSPGTAYRLASCRRMISSSRRARCSAHACTCWSTPALLLAVSIAAKRARSAATSSSSARTVLPCPSSHAAAAAATRPVAPPALYGPGSHAPFGGFLAAGDSLLRTAGDLGTTSGAMSDVVS